MNNKDFHDQIIDAVKTSCKEQPSYSAAKIAMACLDLTSLTGQETDADIKKLCTKAIQGNVAGVCVYPNNVALAAKELTGTEIAIATVFNFDKGSHRNNGEIATADTTREDILHAIDDRATEIDIVVDYEKFKSMDANGDEEIEELLSAAKETCGDRAKLKVIVESAAFSQPKELYDLSMLALESGADFIKTSTGKYQPADDEDPSGATLEAAATMAMAVRDFNEKKQTTRGLKISGGINGGNYGQYVEVVRNVLGQDYLKPEAFRFGASGVYEDLKMTLDTRGQMKKGAEPTKPSARRKTSAEARY